jgi:AcrR family transcriptional regulator
MTIARDSFHHGDLGNAALQCALHLVETNGVQSLTWRGLAEQLGVNHRALYRHFTDREDIVLRIANLGFERLTEYCLAAISDLKPPESFRALMSAYVEFAFSRPKLYELMFSVPLKEEFDLPTDLSRSLKRLVELSLSASKQPSDVSSVSRDRVIGSISQAHGLILLFQAGVFKSKSPSAAKKYICSLINKSI